MASLPLIERFLSKVDTSGECWIWTASTDSRGYGQISTRRGTAPARAHRVSYELFAGPIPQGQVICHRCDVPRCVRPSHLFAGTQRENLRDASAKKRLNARSLPNLRPGAPGYLGAGPVSVAEASWQA